MCPDRSVTHVPGCTGGTGAWTSYAHTAQLVGASFFQQMVPIALDAQGAWTAVTATNALQLTVGSL
ncbi:MAG: hypothetical protein ACK533_01430 [Planctomycetota bacterium]